MSGHNEEVRPPKYAYVSIKNEGVVLHRAENPWRPVRFDISRSDLPAEEKETKDLLRKVTGILNKVTPQKFDVLVDQLRNLHIETLEQMEGIVDLIFKKAVYEPVFCRMYAELCKEMQSVDLEFPSPTDPNKKVTFRVLLITKCQTEFEKEKPKELYFADKGEIDKCKDLVKCMFEERNMIWRKKVVGVNRFIGELFKSGFLTSNILVRCMLQLVSRSEEISLECLCVLLSTAGRELEEKIGPVELDSCFQKITQRKSLEISSRVKFMVQDTIDLRNNNWVPRRQPRVPRTIEEINKEIEEDELWRTNKKLKKFHRRKIHNEPAEEVLQFEEIPSVPAEGELHQSENPWKPSRFEVNNGSQNSKEKTLQKFHRTMLCILNKLNVKNFEKLVSSIPYADICTLDKLMYVTDLVFRKAIDEPLFCAVYARLCCEITKDEFEFLHLDISGKKLNFRVLLITKCQMQFEIEKPDEQELKKLEQKITERAELSEKKELRLQYEELKRKCVGNCRFIGELFKVGMLTPKILSRCMSHLLTDTEEEKLEQLCMLLSTAGKELESNIGKDAMEPYFQQIQTLSESSLSLRIRFMLLDMIDLRKNSWIPRLPDVNAAQSDHSHDDIIRKYSHENTEKLPPRKTRKSEEDVAEEQKLEEGVDKPWWNAELAELRRQTRRLFTRAKYTGNWSAYKSGLREYNRARRKAKRELYERWCKEWESASFRGEVNSHMTDTYSDE